MLLPISVTAAAARFGALIEPSGKESLYGRIGIAGVAGIDLDPRRSETFHRASAEASAYELRDAEPLQVTDEGVVVVASVADDLGGGHLPVLDMIDLELLGAAEVLPDLAVVISRCNDHATGIVGARIKEGPQRLVPSCP